MDIDIQRGVQAGQAGRRTAHLSRVRATRWVLELADEKDKAIHTDSPGLSQAKYAPLESLHGSGIQLGGSKLRCVRLWNQGTLKLGC
jgi:hypothetical protein